MEFPLFKRCNLSSCGAYRHRLYRFFERPLKNLRCFDHPLELWWKTTKLRHFVVVYTAPKTKQTPTKKPMETLKMIDGLRDITQLIGKCRTSIAQRLNGTINSVPPPKKSLMCLLACLFGSLSVCLSLCLFVCFFVCLFVFLLVWLLVCFEKTGTCSPKAMKKHEWLIVSQKQNHLEEIEGKNIWKRSNYFTPLKTNMQPENQWKSSLWKGNLYT